MLNSQCNANIDGCYVREEEPEVSVHSLDAIFDKTFLKYLIFYLIILCS